MNYTSFASLLIAMLSAFMGQFVYHKNPKSILNRLFFLSSILLSYETFCEFMYRQALSHDVAFFWLRMASLWPFAAAFLIHFSLVFTEKKKLLSNTFTYIALYFPALVVSILIAFSDWILKEAVMSASGWTFQLVYSPVTLGVAVWILCLIGLFLLINIRFIYKARDKIKKKQVLITTICVMLTLAISAAYRWLESSVQARLPEVGSVAVFLLSVSIGYVVWKYKLFYLDIQTSSDAIIRTLADAMLLVDNEGVIVKTNPAAAKLLQYRENFLEGMKLKSILGDQDLLKKIRTKQLLKDGSLKYIETYIRQKNEEFIPVGLSISVVKDDFNREQGMIYVFRDLTERRKIEEELWKYRNRLEKMVESRTIELTKVNTKLRDEIERCKLLEQNVRESQERYRSLIEEQQESVIRWDMDTTLTFVNTSNSKLLKMEKEELIGKKWILMIPKAYRRKIQEDLEELKQKPRELRYQTPVMDSRGNIIWLDWLAKPLYDEKGDVKEYQASGRDITDQKSIEEELEKAQGRIRAIYESANQIAFIITDLGTPVPKITEFSPGAEKIFGYDRDDVIDKPMGILCTPEEARKIPEFYKKIKNKRTAISSFTTMYRNGNEPFHAFHTAYPLLDTDGEMYSVLTTTVDMSELKKMQDAVTESQLRQKAILENIPDMAWMKDKDSKYIAVNEAFCKAFGKRSEDIIGKNDFDLSEKELALFYRKVDQEVMHSGTRKIIEEPLVVKGGKVKIIAETIKTPVWDEKGEIIGTTGIARDITQRKQSEDIVRRSLAEKETLLQEIHHRLKNNLQVISGILYLEARKVNDKNVEEIIRHSISRLDTMAMIHAQLYEYNRHGEVDMNAFLKRLSGYLLQIYQSPGREFKIDCEATGVCLTINQAMPLGLMVNEMITNSIIHGFKDKTKGLISIRMTERNFRVRFLYEDDGSGMKEKVDISKAESMGFQLIYNLGCQLSAIMKVTSLKAMKYDMEFDNILSAAGEV